MTSLSIADLHVTHGPTWRKTKIGDTYLTVWIATDNVRTVEYKAATRRGDIVQHLKFPSEVHHLDRAFEHAVQEVLEQEARRIASQHEQGEEVS